MERKKIRILQIINEPWTSAILDHGLTLSKGLKERGHQVIIAGLRNSPLVEEAKKNGLRLELIDEINSLNPVNVFKAVKRLRDIMNKEEIDVVDTHRAEGQTLGILANGLARKKAVLIRTRGDQRPAKNNLFNRCLYRYFTDRIVVASLMAKQNHFIKFGIENKIMIIKPAVDTRRFNPEISGESFRQEFGIKKDELLIGIIGRLDPVKGHKYFLEAVSFLKNDFQKVKYIIVGQEQNVKIGKLKEIIASLGLEGKIVFTGFYKDIEKAVAGIDIGVVASIGSEAISRVTLEMMACAKPVVGTRVGSIPELILDGETGLLCDPSDSRGLAESIKKLVLEPRLITEMGRCGFLRAKELFSIGNMINKTEELYFNVLEEKWKR